MVHHIAHDRWSRDLLRREVSLAYAAALAGEEPTLPALPLTVLDVAGWQRALLAGPVGDTLTRWWTATLDGVSRSGGFRRRTPSEAPAKPARAVAGRRLSADLARGVRGLANRADVSPFVVGLTAYAALLAEQGSGEDFVIWTPMAGREDGRVHGLVGYLANVVALRVDVRGITSNHAMIERIRDTLEGAYAHQDLPMQALPTQLRPRSLFAYQNTPGYPLRLPGCTVEPIEIPGGVPDFESFLELAPAGAELLLSLSYDRSALDPAEVEAALDRYIELLAELVTERELVGSLGGSWAAAASEPVSNPNPIPSSPAVDGSRALLARLPTLDRGQRQAQIAAWLSSRLDTSELERSLQALGVGSLVLLQLLAAIEREFGVGLPLSQDLTQIPLHELAERTLDRVELESLLRRPAELADQRLDLLEL